MQRKPREEFRHEYTCVNCVYEPGVDEIGKYAVVYKNGKLRIKLKAISANLFICPKCADKGLPAMHIGPEFKDPKAGVRIRNRKWRKRLETLTAMNQKP